MNAHKPGMDMPSSTRRTRRDHREQVERVRREDELDNTPESQTPQQEEETPMPPDAPPVPRPTLVPRARPAKTVKKPFATQIKLSTHGRLEWLRRQDYSLTDTVDDALNAWLDAVGVPPADEHGDIQQ